MARPSPAGPSQSRSRRPNNEWPGPGIFVKMDFGIALTPSKAKQVSLGYVSKNMQRLIESQGHPEHMRLDDRGVRTGLQPPLEEERRRRPHQRQRRSRSALQLRRSPVSPEAVIISSEQYPPIDYHPFHPEPVYFPSPISARESRPSTNIDSVHTPYRASPTVMGQYPPLHSNSYPPPQTPVVASSSHQEPQFNAVRQTTVDRKPLPPLPSSFRLGSEDMPWSTPTIVDPEEPTFLEPLTYSPPRESRRSRRLEAASSDDPLRTRELGQLNQAMIGVGSLDLGNEWWEPGGNFDRLGELGALPRGPRGIGWAIAVPSQEEDSPSRDRDEGGGQQRQLEQQYNPGFLSPPPAYTQGQWGWDWEWEESYGYWVRVRGLRRSSSIR